MAHLPPRMDDRKVAARAARLGIEVQPVSRYQLGPGGTPGLVLGFGSITPRQIREGMRQLAGAL